MNIIKDLAHRRVPHIIGSYIFATTSMIIFADWLFNRYEFPEYYTTYILFTFLLLLPSVSLSATVYESDDPNIKLKKGDIVLF